MKQFFRSALPVLLIAALTVTGIFAAVRPTSAAEMALSSTEPNSGSVTVTIAFPAVNWGGFELEINYDTGKLALSACTKSISDDLEVSFQKGNIQNANGTYKVAGAGDQQSDYTNSNFKIKLTFSVVDDSADTDITVTVKKLITTQNQPLIAAGTAYKHTVKLHKPPASTDSSTKTDTATNTSTDTPSSPSSNTNSSKPSSSTNSSKPSTSTNTSRPSTSTNTSKPSTSTNSSKPSTSTNSATTSNTASEPISSDSDASSTGSDSSSVATSDNTIDFSPSGSASSESGSNVSVSATILPTDTDTKPREWTRRELILLSLLIAATLCCIFTLIALLRKKR